MQMKPVEPIVVVDRFPPLHYHLMQLLARLRPEDWERPAVGAWTVRDIAAHLLDSDLRRLSLCRDAYRPPSSPGDDLIGFLEGLNADWVKAAERLGPRVLVELLAWSAPQVHAWFASLDPHAEAAFAVSWAEDRSEVWMDTAREYVEKWHHQEQVREAVGALRLDGYEWIQPVVDCCLRVLPRAYERTPADDGTTVSARVTGVGGGDWTLLREGGGWKLFVGRDHKARAGFSIDARDAWKLLTKGLTPEEGRARSTVFGSDELTRPFFHALAIVGRRD